MEWVDVTEFRAEYMRGLESVETIRKGAKIINEYLEAGWRIIPPYSSDIGTGATRILSISDLHVPYQLPTDTFAEYRGKIDILQINGDIVDHQALSRWSKVYRDSPMEEIIQAREYIISLIEYIDPSEVVVTYGNHCIRFQNFIAKNLDSDILELLPQTSLDLIFEDGFRHYNKKTHAKTWYDPIKSIFPNKIINYTENWYCQIGKTIFCHPLSFNSGIMKTSERAMTWFRNEGYDFDTLVMAHTHRSGSYCVGNTVLYEQGCCCKTSEMNYSDGKLVNSQKEGFLYLCHDKNGKNIRDQSKLIIIN